MRSGSAPALDCSRLSCSSVFRFLFLIKGIFGAITTRRMRRRLNWESPGIGQVIFERVLQKIKGLTKTLEGRFEKEKVLVYVMGERKES
jgi:hypothetical protein